MAPPEGHIESRPGRSPVGCEHVTPLRERKAAGAAKESDAVVRAAVRVGLDRESLGVRPGQTEAQPARLADVKAVVGRGVETLGGVDADVLGGGIHKAVGGEPE